MPSFSLKTVARKYGGPQLVTDSVWEKSSTACVGADINGFSFNVKNVVCDVVVDHLLFRYSTSTSVPEIFAIKFQSCIFIVPFSKISAF